MVCDALILESDAVNLGSSCCNVHLLHNRGPLHHRSEVECTHLEVGAVGEL